MNSSNHRRAVGTFATYHEAENALNDLRDSRFPMNHVSIIAKDSEQLERSDRIGDINVQAMAETTHADDGAKTGAATGGTLGGITGLLVGLGTLAIPGVGPVMLAGATATAIATALAGGAIGAAAGGLVGGLVGLGIPEDRARSYHDSVAHGGYLVIVDGSDAEILSAETILRRRGIHNWDVYNAPIAEGTPGSSARL